VDLGFSRSTPYLVVAYGWPEVHRGAATFVVHSLRPQHLTRLGESGSRRLYHHANRRTQQRHRITAVRSPIAGFD